MYTSRPRNLVLFFCNVGLITTFLWKDHGSEELKAFSGLVPNGWTPCKDESHLEDNIRWCYVYTYIHYWHVSRQEGETDARPCETPLGDDLEGSIASRWTGSRTCLLLRLSIRRTPQFMLGVREPFWNCDESWLLACSPASLRDADVLVQNDFDIENELAGTSTPFWIYLFIWCFGTSSPVLVTGLQIGEEFVS